MRFNNVYNSLNWSYSVVTSPLGRVVVLTIISAYVLTTIATSGRRGHACWVDGMLGCIPELDVVGDRCEVGEAGELWDVVATIYRMRARTEIWVMTLGHVICSAQYDGKWMPIGAIKLAPENGA